MAGLSEPSGSAPVVAADRENVKTLAPETSAPAETSSTIKAPGLFETPLWAALTDGFPVWAEQRRTEALELMRNGAATSDVKDKLILSVAQLRRRHWQHALSSDPATLRNIAQIFLDNLKTLTEIDVNTCYAFIRNGEASQRIRKMISEGKNGDNLLRQTKMIIDAIVAGRRDPNTHAPPLQKDYRLITAELTRIGWTNEEMTLFGDPAKLAKAEPAQVCKLVTDWFTAQLTLQDEDAKTRLLVQSLRPVVSG